MPDFIINPNFVAFVGDFSVNNAAPVSAPASFVASVKKFYIKFRLIIQLSTIKATTRRSSSMTWS